MAQRALPLPAARLGRAVRTAGAPTAVSGVVLLLPDGEADSHRRPSPLSYALQLPLARTLARAGREDGLTAHVVRYRCRGWNATDAQLAADARWAVDEVVRRYGDVPVCLAGHGMGGRAALHAGGHAAVSSVLAMAPWLPENVTGEPEPVKHLLGRQVLLVHGTNDARTDPELSFRLAERAKKANRDTCRFEVHSDGHGLRQHRAEVAALATDFVRGSLFGRAYARPVADALAAPPPLGLRMPLAAGFGKSLRD
ncbi:MULTISPECIES: alpha/beta hydrolase [unclassified Streptomyces]|uniref:alpha/beta hydrolase n=1 Tax=unclassified Streptomyces TaxID=2593676 RepID=UPI00225BD345|nr:MULTISPECIES: alpha/beta hydrolase [unclassified Streptomyces]WSU22198.1 alpha/beta hydrolase [Streptomyces sp. NBC_01108]MCX4788885.1 alpha/beta hydrolase [Streptomyces sp. NBC_01221]MCX4795367.1 alpha/beta hydrolase [Streptomyces sp. NBC_01242]WSJ36671.1 alpha/beta hydrolase [Streptomyces sp. NBC_01321]WSP63089.1 alpha/beta hydrolase [Streptomyces sp. NBC_01240]